LRESLRLERRATALALAASAAVAVATVALSGTAAWLIVRSAQRPPILSLTLLMGVVQLLALAKAVGRYAERVTTHEGALRVMTRVRALTASRLEPLVPAGLGARSADVVETIIGDVDKVQDLLVAVAGPLSANLIAGLCAVTVGGFIAPATALVFAAGIIAVGVVLPLGAARAGRGPQHELNEARALLRHALDDTARSGDEYRALGATHVLYERCALAERTYDRAVACMARRAGVFNALNVLAAGLTVIAIVANTQRALESHALAQSLLAVPALLALSTLELVGAASGSLLNVRSGLSAAGRLDSLVSRPRPVREPSVPAALGPESTIELSDVGVWRDGHAVLDHVTDAWRTGDVVALSGPSGSGKTTLAHLLARFIEARTGDAALGGVSLGDLTGEQVRTRVGFVSDDPHVFSTTLGQNMRLARPDADDDEIMSALLSAGLAPLLATLPDGLATQLGDGAGGLSGGERRRLGVARAFLARRPVMILDEPTEGLDDVDADALMREVCRHQLGAIVVVISHQRLEHLRAPKHLRADQGRVRATR
jgi:thiol reductant ABC exporter CydC subunit